MFFSNVYAKFNVSNAAPEITMYKNVNALSAVSVNNIVYPQGENPFTATSLMITPQNEIDGVPTFTASLTGINSTLYPNPYFYIDFTTTQTVVWNVDCTHDQMETYYPGSCSTKPTLM